MLLSIVIPTHNRFDYLKQCLEALVSSIGGHSDCEVIVIDDHSKSEVAAANQALCNDLHIGYCYQEKNKGAAVARNEGIKRSKGEWIAFLDDDVCVESDWYGICAKTVSELPPPAIGLEGRLVATGEGVWDKEVENLNGRAYLSCHIIYRKNIFERAGRFDERFASRYPTCEDHELAVRALLLGDIAFNPHLCARHLPRTIHRLRYLSDSFHRIRSLLDAEFYFYSKHRDRYHVLRHARTFWGTYKNIILSHFFVSLKRRSPERLIRHPFQCMTLVGASLIEQATALCMLPHYVSRYVKDSRFSFFKEHIDENCTRTLWRMKPKSDLSALLLKPLFLRSLFFPLVRRPVYSMAPFLQRIKDKTSLSNMRIFLRIDDVFLNDPARVALFCEKIAEKKIGYCAGIIGNDLTSGTNARQRELIRQSGGEIALHGFTHLGRFGPYKSEIMQMNFPAIETALQATYEHLPSSDIPRIFIPPYNTISREQIVFMTRYFKIICGGPETARFTDYYTGPVALQNNAWYFPSFFPFYDNAAHILKSNAFKKVLGQKGVVCITVHMPLEAQDNFHSLMELIGCLADSVTPWKYLYSSRG